MKGKLNSQLGEINISEDVISSIAGTAAMECFGVVGMASVGFRDGIVKLLKLDSLGKGIGLEFSEDNSLTIKVHIIVAYGLSIYAVADNLIENIRYKVEDSTGLKVDGVEVYVEGVRLID